MAAASKAGDDHLSGPLAVPDAGTAAEPRLTPARKRTSVSRAGSKTAEAAPEVETQAAPEGDTLKQEAPAPRPLVIAGPEDAPAEIRAERRELVELALEYGLLTGNSPKPEASDSVRNSHARRIVADLLTLKEERVREWFYRNPVPGYALFGMRMAVRAERLARGFEAMAQQYAQADAIGLRAYDPIPGRLN